MHSKIIVSWALTAALCLSGAIAATAAQAEQKDAALKRGGQLYDKWYKMTATRPQGTHPLYPQTGKKKGDTTWRCKECHGWDYIGRDGGYKTGSHFTGIKGVLGAAHMDEKNITAALSGGIKGHDFSSLMDPAKDIKPLVAFLRKGLVDIATVLAADGTIKGNSAN